MSITIEVPEHYLKLVGIEKIQALLQNELEKLMEDAEDEADIADALSRLNDEHIAWEEAKHILDNKEKRDAL
jgi:hypothetical protein